MSAENRSAFNVQAIERLPGHLYFSTREDWKGEVPVDQSELRKEFDMVCGVLRARFKNQPERFNKEFERLLDLAHATFSNTEAQVKAGGDSLQAYKLELIRAEGLEIKNSYLRELAVCASKFSLVTILIAALGRIGLHYSGLHGLTTSVPPESLSLLGAVKWPENYSILHFGLLIAAAVWGSWISFAVRNMQLSFEQLQHAEPDLMKPWSRLLMVSILTLILGLFFQMGIVVISIGGVSTSGLSQNAAIAILVGLCAGFMDKLLPQEVNKRINELMRTTRPDPSATGPS